MQHVQKAARLRSMSMEEYDLPRLRTRSMSGGSGDQACSPISGSPPLAPKVSSYWNEVFIIPFTLGNELHKY